MGRRKRNEKGEREREKGNERKGREKTERSRRKQEKLFCRLVELSIIQLEHILP